MLVKLLLVILKISLINVQDAEFTNSSEFALFLVVLHDRSSGLVESLQPELDRLHVVIRSATERLRTIMKVGIQEVLLGENTVVYVQ